MPVDITTPQPAEIRPALDLLLRRSSNEDVNLQIESFLTAVDRGEVSLDGLRVARLGGLIVGAVMSVNQADGVAHVWPPRLIADVPLDVELQLALECHRIIVESGAAMAQCLTPVEDHAAQAVLEQVGFSHLTDLVCWQHELNDMPSATPHEECVTIDYSLMNSEHFEAVMQQTYEGSQDCSALHERRSARDSLISHRLASNDDSSLWKLHRRDAEDVGVVICADQSDQQMWELLYMGVIPRFRNRGFGRAMLSDVLRQAREAGAQGVYLAADSANKMAANLYAACGFVEAFRERIHVWFPPASSR